MTVAVTGGDKEVAAADPRTQRAAATTFSGTNVYERARRQHPRRYELADAGTETQLSCFGAAAARIAAAIASAV